MGNGVNSNSYWNQRFNSDWEDNQGRQQTQFFARMAMQLMPEWLSRDIRREQMTICDWGCAEGDATDVFASHYSTPVTGVDFAQPGIERARSYYPDRQFLHANFLEEDNGERFDIVFSSNTLEHFKDPFSTLERVASRAKRHVVLLLPFQEFERIAEHFATFDFSNIPFTPHGFMLVHARIADTGAMTPSYWPGQQVLLVYSRREIVEDLRLAYGDVRLDHPEHLSWLVDRDSLSRELGALKDSMVSLMQESAVRAAEYERIMAEVRSRDQALADRMKDVARLEAEREALRIRIGQLTRQVDEMNDEHAQALAILNSHSWQFMRPFRAIRRWFSR